MYLHAERIMAAAGLLLIDPNVVTDIIGVALIAAVIAWQIIKQKGIIHKQAA
jgi:UPF0716 family protein affecting phage T7 exclusion